MQLLKQLCSIHAPSGNEGALTDFILHYVKENKQGWKVQPQVFHGDDFQNCIILVFGTPKLSVYAHIDSIGYTVRYKNQLVQIGSPHGKSGDILTGKDRQGKIEAILVSDKDEGRQFCKYHREIERGTDLVFKSNFIETDEYVQSCYLDNRLGVWNALRLCETLENGAVVFSCWEEHGGGSTGYLSKFLFEKYHIRMALVSDITWITEGVHHGKGVVISMRDTGIPRRQFIDTIIALADSSKVPYQLEVEGSGGSDGTELQKTPLPIDWCFIGAGESNVHSPNEKVHKQDIESMLQMYNYLFAHLV
jgi:putative aminopeptidase FrvX